MVTTSEGITSSLAILVFLMVQGTAGSSLLQGIAEPAPPAPLAHSGAASSRSACAATVRCAARWPLTQASHRPTAPHSACCRSEQASSHMAHSGAACSRSACAATVRCAVRRPLAQAPHRPAASHSACCRSERAPLFILVLLQGIASLSSTGHRRLLLAGSLAHASAMPNPSLPADSSGLYFDDSGNVVNEEGDLINDAECRPDDDDLGLFIDPAGNIVDEEGDIVEDAECGDLECDDNEWAESDICEFNAFLSDKGVDDPDAALQLVPDGVALMTFARYFAELDGAQRARLWAAG